MWTGVDGDWITSSSACIRISTEVYCHKKKADSVSSKKCTVGPIVDFVQVYFTKFMK